MTKSETVTLMAIIKIAYPQYYSQQSDVAPVIALWSDMFKDDDFKIVSAAVKSFIACDTRGFPPSIGIIKSYISKIVTPEELTEQEAWGIVRVALENSSYNSKEEFAKLPPDIQKLLGSHTQLMEWARTDISELNTVISSNFMRSYRARSKSIREYNALPNEVRSLISSISQKHELPTFDFDKEKNNALKLLEDWLWKTI